MYIIYIIFICTLKYITVNRCTHLKGALKKKHRTRASWRKSDSFLRSGTEIGDSLPWTWAFPHLVQQLEAVGSHASGAGMQDFVAIKNLLGLVLSCEVHGPQLVDDIIWILHWHLDTYFATFWTKLTHPLQVGGSWRHIPSRLEASLDLICVGNKFGPSQQHSLSEYNKSLTKRLVAKMFKTDWCFGVTHQYNPQIWKLGSSCLNHSKSNTVPTICSCSTFPCWEGMCWTSPWGKKNKTGVGPCTEYCHEWNSRYTIITCITYKCRGQMY